ncbi:MAG: cadherin domain-containing protein [Pirellulales bacterium]
MLATNTGATFAENSTANVISSSMLQTTDVDHTASQLTYTITSATSNGTLYKSGVAMGTNSTFTQADINSGIITYSHNGSETSSDAFQFSVDDGVGTTSSGTFSLTITPVNDNAPIITSNGGGTTASINVNETLTSVTTVTATDADLPAVSLTYSLSGADAAHFSINSSGVLAFVSAPDFEAPTDADGNNVYVVVVQVSDGTLTDTQTLSVTVQNVISTLTVTTASDFDDSGLGSAYTIEQLNAVNGGTDGKISLREALIAANNTSGIDTISFNISALEESFVGTSGTDGRWILQLASALPTITEGVVIDGATQTTNAGNTNVGTLSSGSVGVDGLSLTTVQRPEIVIVGKSTIAAGFDVGANNTTIRGLGMYGFTNGAAISLQNNVTGTMIENNVIGSLATGITDPGSSLRNLTGISSNGADSGTVRNNILSFNGQTGLYMANASNSWTITGNTFQDGGIGFSNGDGIAIANSTSITIQGNSISGTSTQAIILSGSTTSVTIDNNTITNNGIGPSGGATVQSDAIAIRSGVSNITISENVIANNYGAGITVNNGATGVRITQNSMYGNGTITARDGSAATGQIGIDLQSSTDNTSFGSAPYYTTNDANDADSGGNSLQNFPVLTVANSTGTALSVGGTFQSVANRTYTLEFFSNTASSANGYLQGRTYLGSINVTTDGSGNATFSTSLGVSVAATDFITATATDTTTNETSEFGAQLAVNVATTTVSDAATALEAGGIANATAGTNPSGNVLTNDSDVDPGDSFSVTGVAAGVVSSASGSVASSVTGSYGSIQIQSDGTYSYTVDNNNTTVQALRTTSNTLQDVFSYTVTDAAGMSSTTQITVTIQGANDTPYDLSASATSIVENSANGTSIGTFTPTDRDSGDTFTYSLVDSAGGRFAIGNSTGILTVANSSLLNYESNTSHSITVRVTDAAGTTYDEIFVIQVTDADEFDVGTVTDTNAASNAINENVSIGTTVGITASASDADGTTNTITYSLFNNDGGRFTIDANSGVVTVAGAINRETDGASRTITVRATSADGSYTDQNFTIGINDIDEFDVGTVSDTNATTNAVNENAANGTLVGLTASASDSDATNSTVTYTLTDSASGRFAIDLNTGVVTVANGTLLNREANASHTVTVRDFGRWFLHRQNFSIGINDVDEFDVGTVTDTNATTNAVDENASVGTVVGITATASDADSTTNNITYTLFNNDGGRFAIDANTGVVTVAGAINREADGASRTITVRATSADGSYTDQNFSIGINDIDEFDVGTVSDTNATTNAVNENAANGTLVGLTAAASDSDATNSTVTYTLDRQR